MPRWRSLLRTVRESGLDVASINQLYVNNNGNVTFAKPRSSSRPEDLTSGPVPIAAPFFADIDTRVAGEVSFARGTIDGRAALAVNWVAAGSLAQGASRTNTFQLVLIERSDIAAGAFDLEFNYHQINWDGVPELKSKDVSAQVGIGNGSKGYKL